MQASLSVELHTQQDGKVPDWIHLVPSGTFTGTDGRGPFTLSDPQAVLMRSLPPDGRPIPVDYNHATHHVVNSGGEAPAAGWISQLQVRDDGIWGRVEWTSAGADAVAAKHYRFLSPGFTTDTEKTVKKILSAGLTNAPNLPDLVSLNTVSPDAGTHDQLLAVLALPDGASQEEIEARALQAIGREMSFKGQLCSTLRRSPTLSNPEILAAIMSMAAETHTIRPDKGVPIELFQRTVAELNRASSGVSQDFAEHLADDAIEKRRLMPWMRDWAVQLCTVNKVAFDDFVTGTAGQQIVHLHHQLTTPLMPPGMEAEARRRGNTHTGVSGNPVLRSMGISNADARRHGDRQ